MRAPSLVSRLLRDQRGATAVEYGLILTAVTLAVVAGATLVGQGLSHKFSVLATFFGG